MTVIATAGHVDHGKSSLIRAITGTDPDRLAEEQRRAMTIDLGFAHCTTSNGTVLSFVDVPGHADFIRTMISGVSGVDIVMLVIDANEGWKPQTEEHLGIIEVLGTSSGIVVITKSDKVDAETLEHRRKEIAARLSTSSVTWHDTVITSVIDNTGISELITHIETLVAAQVTKSHNTRPRLFIDRVFSMKGSGTVVTGTLEGGDLEATSSLIVARTGSSVRIREIQTHGSIVTIAQSGSRCAINLSGINANELQRGDALVCEGDWHMSSAFDGRIKVLPALQHALTHRGSFTLHVGTRSQSATIRILQTDNIDPGQSGLLRIRFDHSLPLVPGDRFLLRDTGIGATVGGGVILDVDPRGRVKDATPDGSDEQILNNRGWLTVDEARQLTGQDIAPIVGNWVASAEIFRSTVAALEQQLSTVQSIDTSLLAAYERDVLSTINGVQINNGIAVQGESDPLLSHPYVLLFLQAGITTPDADKLDRNIIRQLVQKKILFEHDNIAFHVETLSSLRPVLEQLWAEHPEGFTMATLRDALGITRKHALPLGNCLDKVGLTKRQGDLRIAGSAW
ncbi:MAG: selenocysteine-specific translation elongation factor [Ilumatobacteraceae bacterium]|nr:selenocysteine-specific translation elongation factor [Ilumatobacteraceae bacterium]